ncbi:MAG: metallophosphoesterase [Bacteroidetes bacterium]|nr:metallophosphoesterase [Bacteroidota bacterium]
MNKKSVLVLFCFFLGFCFMVDAQSITSPFNNKALKNDSLKNGVSFIVTGHLHGASSNISGFPASTLLANIDAINGLNADFLISLGDLFLDVNDYYVLNYQKSFFDKLSIPLFNSVGNHDLSGNLYEGYFGKTYFSFVYNDNLFIYLDTEKNDGSIKGEQMDLFNNAISKAQQNININNIFISSHRPVWAENNPRYSAFFKDNTQTQFGSNNFETAVLPQLKELSDKSIYWFSGSMGGATPVSFFYDKQAGSNITFINTAIRDLKRDAILEVRVQANNEVIFKTVSLTGESLLDLADYNIEFWNNNLKSNVAPFNYRLIPYLTLQMIKHNYFWIGIFSGVIITFLLVMLKKRFRS